MTSLNELSPKSLMQQVRHHHSIKEESLEKDLKKLELNSDEKVLERERADSKLLIQEIDSETSSTEINCKAASTLENSNYDKIPINTDDNVHCKNLFHQVVGYVFNIKNKPTASFNLQFLDSDFDYEAQELENRHLLRLTPRENGKKDLSLYFRFYSHEAEMIATAENLLKTSDTKVWKVQNPVMPLGDIKVKFSKKSKHLLITMHSLDI
ncbi:hypothetical protein HMI56_007503 [Coelomomyces lativittatus]|nr:hypothetical protein HMI56_007503 [Coelomomyces lativittatus]